MTEPKKIEPNEEMKIALDNRAFEIQLFWQRSNYFLVLMSALGIGAFTIKDPYLSPVISVFATACSYLWFKTNLGSKFWQESWEVEVTRLAHEFGVRSFVRPTSDVVDQVKHSLSSSRAGERHSPFRRWIDRLVAQKPSVTYHMIILSLVSLVVWCCVTIVFTARLLAGAEPEPSTASIKLSRTEIISQQCSPEISPTYPRGTSAAGTTPTPSTTPPSAVVR